MPVTGGLYRMAVRAGVALAPLAGRLSPKLAAGHRGRTAALTRLERWRAQGRDPDRPLVWFHASSVGEGLQAESVILALRALRPDCQIAFTHFSPSATGLAGRLDADVSDYLPYDTAESAERLLSALSPAALVFSKLDLWPELATRAARRGTRVALVAATVSPGSGRLRWPASMILRPGYAALDRAGAISPDDARRLTRLGVRADRIEITGDPRYDSVTARVAAEADSTGGASCARVTLVAGSTWPRDERVLLHAFARVRARHPRARLIIVPHEPTPHHLAAVERRALETGLPAPVSEEEDAPDAPLVLVRRTGLLARLYGRGEIAYVGGGFGRAGLHSVLEPAAWARPVLFGPRWEESRDAGLLLHAEGASALPSGLAAATLTLSEWWERWLAHDDERRAAGRRAHRVVELGLGAAERSAVLLEALLPGRRGG